MIICVLIFKLLNFSISWGVKRAPCNKFYLFGENWRNLFPKLTILWLLLHTCYNFPILHCQLRQELFTLWDSSHSLVGFSLSPRPQCHNSHSHGCFRFPLGNSLPQDFALPQDAGPCVRHSCKKCFCLREPVFWGRIFLILRRNFPNME